MARSYRSMMVVALAFVMMSPDQSGAQTSARRAEPALKSGRLVRVEDRFGLPVAGVRVAFLLRSELKPVDRVGEDFDSDLREAAETSGLWTLTNARGHARLAIDCGAGFVLALKGDSSAKSWVHSHASHDVNLQLLPDRLVTVEVRDTRGKPVPGIRILGMRLMPAFPVSFAQGTTGSDGRWVLHDSRTLKQHRGFHNDAGSYVSPVSFWLGGLAAELPQTPRPTIASSRIKIYLDGRMPEEVVRLTLPHTAALEVKLRGPGVQEANSLEVRLLPEGLFRGDKPSVRDLGRTYETLKAILPQEIASARVRSGSVRFPHLQPDTALNVIAWDRELLHEAVMAPIMTGAAGEVKTLEIELEKGHPFTARLVDERGRTLKGSIGLTEPFRPLWSPLNADGRLRLLPPLPKGRWGQRSLESDLTPEQRNRFTIWHRGDGAQTTRFAKVQLKTERGDLGTIVLRRAPVCSHGWVRNVRGEAVPNAIIRAHSHGRSLSRLPTTSAADGSYELRARLPDEHSLLLVSARGYAPRHIEIETAKEVQKKRIITLERFGKLQGRILLPHGVSSDAIGISWSRRLRDVVWSTSQSADPDTGEFMIDDLEGKGRLAFHLRPFSPPGEPYCQKSSLLWETPKITIEPGKVTKLEDVDLSDSLHVFELFAPPEAMMAKITGLNGHFRRIPPGIDAPIRLVSTEKPLKIRVGLEGWRTQEVTLEGPLTTLRLTR